MATIREKCQVRRLFNNAKKEFDMKNLIEELNATKVPIVKINESLKTFIEKKRFERKLKQMNDILLSTEMPKEIGRAHV